MLMLVLLALGLGLLLGRWLVWRWLSRIATALHIERKDAC